MEFRKLRQKVANGDTTAEVRLEGRAFLNLAVPLATAQIAQFSVGFVDTIMMGRLSTASLAAGGLAATTFQMLLAIFGGFVMSVGVLAAEAYGAGEKERIVGLARQGLWLSFLLALPLILLLWQMSPVLSLLQQPQTVVELAQQYFKWISIGVLPALGFAMLRGYLSAFALANVITVIVTVGTVFNIAFNYVFGFGKFGFPRMELAGFALGSGLSFWLMFGLFVAYILRHPLLSRYRFWRGWKHPNLSILKQLMTIGLPLAMTLTVEYGLFSAVTYMAGSLGTAVLAAHNIAFQMMALVFMLPLGMSYATTARVGFWLGKKDRAGMRRAGLVAMAIAGCLLTLTSIVMAVFRRPAIGLFIDLQDPQNKAVIALAMSLLLISAVAQTLDGIQRQILSALHGLQDTRIPLIVSAVTFLGLGLTGGYILCFWFGWGVVGLWIGQYAGVTLGGIIFAERFYRLTGR